MSAFEGKADMPFCTAYVRFLPKADIGRPGPSFAERRLWNLRGSFRLNAGKLDHLAPFLGFVSDELCEVGG
jgi:hypothetical protein